MKTSIISFLFFIFLFTILNITWASDLEDFPRPSIIEKKVAFWKKVYGEVRDTEGVLHDKDRPELIYKIISIDKMSTRQRRNFIRQEKNKLRDLLRRLSKNESPRNEFEEKIQTLLGDKSSSEIWSLSNQIRYQRGQYDRFRKGMERSLNHIDWIMEQCRHYQIPTRLAFLPHVESSFNYMAYSKVGAAGMWQFMRGTGRIYRLRMDYVIDERRDPEKSTHAALKLLQHNYKKLGTWPLALTAYNHGDASILRAINKLGTRDLGYIIANYKGSRFGFASKNFYASFLAASDIAMDYQRYFGLLQPKYIPPSLKITLQDSYLPYEVIRASGMSIDTFSLLNPSIRPNALRGKTPLKANFEIALPVELEMKIPQIQQKLAEMAQIRKTKVASQPSRAIRKKQTKKERPVETKELETLAETQTEIEAISPIDEILDFNSLFALFMPEKSPKPSSDFSPIVKKGSQYNFSIPKIRDNIYEITIEINETLGHYSDWIPIRIQTILNHNRHLSRRRAIQLGHKLRLPISDQKLSEFKEKRLQYHLAIEEDFFNNFNVTGIQNHLVRSRETLNSITQQYDIPLWLLRYYQDINLNDHLYKGQTLIIPIIAPVGDNSVEEITEEDTTSS